MCRPVWVGPTGEGGGKGRTTLPTATADRGRARQSYAEQCGFRYGLAKTARGSDFAWGRP